MSALADYRSLAGFSPEWFVAVPTASGRDYPTALRAQPPTFSGSGRSGTLGVCVADGGGDTVNVWAVGRRRF